MKAAFGWGSGPLGYSGKEEEQDSLEAESHSPREAESRSQHISEWEQPEMAASQQCHSLTVILSFW